MPPRKIILTAYELTGIVIHHSHGGNHAVLTGSVFFLAFSCCSWHFKGSARQACFLKETHGHPPSAAPRWVSFPTVTTAASLLRTPGCFRTWPGLLSLKKSICHPLWPQRNNAFPGPSSPVISLCAQQGGARLLFLYPHPAHSKCAYIY